MYICSIIVFTLALVCVGLMLRALIDKDYSFVVSFSIMFVVCIVFGVCFYNIAYNHEYYDNKTETIFIEELPNQETTYYALTENSREKNFTYYDGEVQQTLTGYFKTKIYYEENLKEPFVEINYPITRANQDKPIEEQSIETIEVHLSK